MKRAYPSLLVLVLAVAVPAGNAAADTIPADKLSEAPLAVPPGPEGEYLKTLHNHIHRRWVDNFLHLVGEKLPAVNPLNDPNLSAEADIVVAGEGQLISAAITRSSGFRGFDDAILEVLHDAIPYPTPPLAARSDDDKLHVHWIFARDQRRDAGITIVHHYDKPEVALPKLLKSGNRAEALRRVAMARAAGQHAEPSFTMLANDWVKATLHEPYATVRQAKYLAGRGDEEAMKWLKAAIRRPELAAEVGAALVSLKVPLCPLLQGWFNTDNWTDHATAATALLTAGDPACAPGLIALLQNGKAHPEGRAAAAAALAPMNDLPDVKKALATVAKDDPNPAARGAAMLAQIKPNAGRAKVFAMVALLRDPAPDIRAAAAAGVVRAGGDTDLADLYVLFKDNDPRPALATLRELERVPSEEATKLIARLARRPQPAVQKAAAELLIRRGARDYYPALKPLLLEPKTDPEVRGLALAGADEATLQAASADPKNGIWPFRARLARGERDQAADWFVAYGSKLTPALQAAAMTDWVTTIDPSQLPNPTANKAPALPGAPPAPPK
jgi:HEAT repeat protein